MRLLFIGDSLIEFFDWEARFREHEVFNFGVAGETVEGLLQRLDTIVAGVSSPDFVFIMSGINNLAMDDKDFPGIYAVVVDRLKDAYPSTRIFIHSLLPVLTPFLRNDEIREMNGELRSIAEKKGVDYEDIHSLFLDEKGDPKASFLLEDGVHLSDEGYRIWVSRIEEIVRRNSGA
jgi:lysophospholipase L1-like esterase